MMTFHPYIYKNGPHAYPMIMTLELRLSVINNPCVCLIPAVNLQIFKEINGNRKYFINCDLKLPWPQETESTHQFFIEYENFPILTGHYPHYYVHEINVTVEHYCLKIDSHYCNTRLNGRVQVAANRKQFTIACVLRGANFQLRCSKVQIITLEPSPEPEDIPTVRIQLPTHTIPILEPNVSHFGK